MSPNVISVTTQDDQETAVQTMSKYDFSSLPVVDAEGRLVGIITVDDAMDIMEEEATEDIAKMAAITPSDKPYLKTGVFEIWKNRIPWLLLLMVSATFTGIVITRFEDALALFPMLIAYIPMMMDTGGNSGSQASVTVIRALSLGEVEFADIFRVIWKEFRVAIMCGVTLTAANFVKLMLLDRLTAPVALTVCVTMLCTVVIAKMVGCTLPMLAKKAGLDPAVMASPFITTIVDVLSLLIYFSFATAILQCEAPGNAKTSRKGWFLRGLRISLDNRRRIRYNRSIIGERRRGHAQRGDQRPAGPLCGSPGPRERVPVRLLCLRHAHAGQRSGFLYRRGRQPHRHAGADDPGLCRVQRDQAPSRGHPCGHAKSL